MCVAITTQAREQWIRTILATQDFSHISTCLQLVAVHKSALFPGPTKLSVACSYKNLQWPVTTDVHVQLWSSPPSFVVLLWGLNSGKYISGEADLNWHIWYSLCYYTYHQPQAFYSWFCGLKLWDKIWNDSLVSRIDHAFLLPYWTILKDSVHVIWASLHIPVVSVLV